MRKHGKDFQAIAEIIGTKNESQVSQFYTSNRKKFNLDEIIKEFNAKQQQEQQKKQILNETQQKASTNANLTNIVNSCEVKIDDKRAISDDDIMEVSNKSTNDRGDYVLSVHLFFECNCEKESFSFLYCVSEQKQFPIRGLCDWYENLIFFYQIFSISLQIDLVDDIPNQEDEDMDDVTIIEPVSTKQTVDFLPILCSNFQI